MKFRRFLGFWPFKAPQINFLTENDPSHLDVDLQLLNCMSFIGADLGEIEPFCVPTRRRPTGKGNLSVRTKTWHCKRGDDLKRLYLQPDTHTEALDDSGTLLVFVCGGFGLEGRAPFLGL